MTTTHNRLVSSIRNAVIRVVPGALIGPALGRPPKDANRRLGPPLTSVGAP